MKRINTLFASVSLFGLVGCHQMQKDTENPNSAVSLQAEAPIEVETPRISGGHACSAFSDAVRGTGEDVGMQSNLAGLRTACEDDVQRALSRKAVFRVVHQTNPSR